MTSMRFAVTSGIGVGDEYLMRRESVSSHVGTNLEERLFASFS